MQSPSVKIFDLFAGIAPQGNSVSSNGSDQTGASCENFESILDQVGAMPLSLPIDSIMNLSNKDMIGNQSNVKLQIAGGSIVAEIPPDATTIVNLKGNQNSEIVNKESLLPLLQNDFGSLKAKNNDISYFKIVGGHTSLIGVESGKDYSSAVNSGYLLEFAGPGNFDQLNSAKSLISDEIVEKSNIKEIRLSQPRQNSDSIELLKSLQFEFGKNAKIQSSDSNSFKNVTQSLIDTGIMNSIDDSAESNDDFVNLKSDSSTAPKANEAKSSGKSDSANDNFGAVLNDKTKSSNLDSKISADQTLTATKEMAKHSDGDSKATQPVKMILPETGKMQNGGHNQSIMIKIEPEHLGPARLDLQLRNDVLTAKLTVETVEAKAVLDNSINHLKDQLAKADIKVEQIQVNVRGETNHNHLFEKQPQWQKPGSAGHFRFNEDKLFENFIPSDTYVGAGMLQYVSSQGVNVLA